MIPRSCRLGLALALGALAGCAKQAPAPAPGSPPAPFKLTVQLDWVAEPEHGAFYTAEALGYFKAEGLDVTLLQGGPNAYVQAKVATGQVQLGQGDSTNSMLAIQAGAPLVNVAAIFQHDPSVLMMQVACPVNTWKDLNGRSIMARPEWAFLPYLRQKYGIKFQVIPQNFDLGRLATDPTFIQQGYYIAEPFFLQEKGIKLKFLHVSDTGFDAYSTLLTSRKFAAAHPAELRAFLRALHRGWQYYLEKDGGPAHAIMLRINPKVSREYLDWSRQQIIDAHLAKDTRGDYLAIAPARFQREIGQLEALGILTQGAVTVEKAMDGSFLTSPAGPPGLP
jgi:NitT/TauT family transport system substrate-binding protein